MKLDFIAQKGHLYIIEMVFVIFIKYNLKIYIFWLLEQEKRRGTEMRSMTKTDGCLLIFIFPSFSKKETHIFA